MLVNYLPDLSHVVMMMCMCMARGEVIDNDGQRSPPSVSTRINNMNRVLGEVIDNVGQRSPCTETNSRIPESGVGNNSINFSQSVTQILASL